MICPNCEQECPGLYSHDCKDGTYAISHCGCFYEISLKDKIKYSFFRDSDCSCGQANPEVPYLNIPSEYAKSIPDIFCNICGTNCKSFHGSHYGLINARITGGYESTYLKDEKSYKFSLCEKCLVNLFKTFKTSVEVKDCDVMGIDLDSTTMKY
jgi:hypothetical protein